MACIVHTHERSGPNGKSAGWPDEGKEDTSWPNRGNTITIGATRIRRAGTKTPIHGRSLPKTRGTTGVILS
jgi:hypothetical protein